MLERPSGPELVERVLEKMPLHGPCGPAGAYNLALPPPTHTAGVTSLVSNLVPRPPPPNQPTN